MAAASEMFFVKIDPSALRLRNTTETQCPLRLPDVLMVVTGGAQAYTREDGVHVVPISALKQ